MQSVILPFIAGFLAVLFFHEATIALLHAAELTDQLPFSTTPFAPLGVPEFLLTALLGALWGIVLAWLLRVGPQRPAPWLGSFVFGGVVLTATTVFVLDPICGIWPSGNMLPRLAFGFVVNAMWGFGSLVFMRAFMTDSDKPS
ncbi:unnamed protein product [Mycetohabitans rhizoxinica HKI 454]|uniref:Uncharacterized protein n=2 Tax=Mycetohabitans rhizoxinica TaxID=412963 RepID=E5ARW7_MYCRK|nr:MULTISPECIES: membrane protein [Mycetohabitans]MCG1047353.1 hypothetical protein [Mycetohabitans sp. B6]CBW75349.1 unnamed protein product [Mycetohabitans rhizoxinica HKI 454]